MWTSTSPDGQWIATGILEQPTLVGPGEEKYYTQLKAAKVDGSVDWTIVDEKRTWGLGYTTPRPFKWSRDGRYLYTAEYGVPDGCGIFGYTTDVRRVDLTDGSVVEIAPGVGGVLSISPDDTTLAHIGDKEIILRDLTTGRERRAAFDPGEVTWWLAGSIVWSSEGASLMFTLVHDPCGPAGKWTHSILQLDTATLSLAALIDRDARQFYTIEWPEVGRALLKDKDGNCWWLNAETGELTPAPEPTATPEISTWTSASPDGKWIAKGMMEGPFPVGDEEKYSTQLRVVSADGSVEWTIVDETSHYGLGYTTPQPFRWSNDGRYMYYTNLPVPDGCAVFINAWGLYRVDLTNGRVTEIATPEAWWLSLSPNEATLASIIWNGRALEVVVRDLAAGAERGTELDAKYSQAGAVVWSPDNQAFILAADQNPCDPLNWTRSFIRVDVATLSQTTLIRDDLLNFGVVEWPEPARVRLSDKDGNPWWMDATTGQLTPVR